MIKYISKWYQDIIKTPRPDVEEAVQQLKEALDNLNIAVANLEKIEGVYGKLRFREYVNPIQEYAHPTTVSFGSNSKKFHASVGYVTENHRREF
jgi:hypothetical protein